MPLCAGQQVDLLEYGQQRTYHLGFMSRPLPSAKNHDIRMRGFANRAAVSDALAWVDRALPVPQTEQLPIHRACGRVLTQSVISDVDVPGFSRGMMDGFAIRATDTQEASSSSQLMCEVIGQALPGQPFDGHLAAGQAVRIMTGAPLPAGADAVLPAENVEIQADRILLNTAIDAGKHVASPGEDIESGTTVLTAPRKLRPQDIGVLSSIGISQVQVVRSPRVRVVTTGNELLPAGSKPHDFLITDANSPMLQALIERDGGHVTHVGIVPDDCPQILEALMTEAEIVVVSGGSSVGQEDHVPLLLAEHGELAIHGIAMRPSSPVGMGRIGSRLVFLLPGNPVSCLCGYDFFAGRAVRMLSGSGSEWPYRKQKLPLNRKLTSVKGRLDYVRVSVVDNKIEPVATAGASVLTSTTRADGFVIIPEEIEAYQTGEEIGCFFYN